MEFLWCYSGSNSPKVSGLSFHPHSETNPENDSLWLHNASQFLIYCLATTSKRQWQSSCSVWKYVNQVFSLSSPKDYKPCKTTTQAGSWGRKTQLLLCFTVYIFTENPQFIWHINYLGIANYGNWCLHRVILYKCTQKDYSWGNAYIALVVNILGHRCIMKDLTRIRNLISIGNWGRHFLNSLPAYWIRGALT